MADKSALTSAQRITMTVAPCERTTAGRGCLLGRGPAVRIADPEEADPAQSRERPWPRVSHCGLFGQNFYSRFQLMRFAPHSRGVFLLSVLARADPHLCRACLLRERELCLLNSFTVKFNSKKLSLAGWPGKFFFWAP